MSPATPSRTVGPFFHYALTDSHSRSELAGPQTRGEHIAIEGRVTDAAGTAVPDAMIEIWQADAGGRFRHPDDDRAGDADPGFLGFGRSATNGNGRYGFRTIRPGPVPGRGNTLQAPHILVAVFARGLLKQLVTRIYFEGEALNESDPVLTLVEETRRDTLITRRDGDGRYVFDIRLSGENETVFFDV